jgi:predicted RNA-binding protein
MCLSNVYLDKKSDDSLLLREASQIVDTDDGVDVATLFGENKNVKGYCVGELNLMDNYVILKPRGGSSNGSRT